ncbi:molybdenum cofactor guanylyltransferase [Polymorphobacter multimanifer]|uniref:Molybdenum cofactor guanylyltransferase n=1 Tax=Polymorphobacter multimanifer TaxID=1070431 RepID=A0A841L0X3_9SPHN|nr:molybdenum cofactor guanylyltransferase [Polymorphobacter multimanifer]MBB6226327.1 molybdopterin-guanine dinucleotide biosynthesis protein A [Polymorphobacter multimanifer]GGI81263.1 molybdenum cofactor guanylyltransferase [Polymorphobacter multimanifer]
MTRILGAILAGGQSRRFGTDKAVACLDGRPLIEHVVAALRRQCDAIVIVGRPFPGLEALADRPHPGLGPLGGLAAALHAGQARGFEMVLTAPCDTPRLPRDLVDILSPSPAYLADTQVIGLWPCAAAALLDAHIASNPRRSMLGWAVSIGAAPRRLALPIVNINTPEDLQGLADAP